MSAYQCILQLRISSSYSLNRMNSIWNIYTYILRKVKNTLFLYIMSKEIKWKMVCYDIIILLVGLKLHYLSATTHIFIAISVSPAMMDTYHYRQYIVSIVRVWGGWTDMLHKYTQFCSFCLTFSTLGVSRKRWSYYSTIKRILFYFNFSVKCIHKGTVRTCVVHSSSTT